VPVYIYRLSLLETVDLSQNKINDWQALPSVDFSKSNVRHLDVSGNAALADPPVDFLRLSLVNKLVLSGCTVDKALLMRNMERNGVKEYQERHKRKLD